MSLLNWIFDAYQHHKIDQLRDETHAARVEMAAVRNSSGGVDVERLERAIGELALATKTLRRLAVAKGLCTDQEFYETLRAIDLEDGKADGRSPVS